MIRRRLGTIRGQLVLWYLSILALLLAALGFYQSFTLTQYLQTSTGDSMRQAAFSELHALGPCYIRSSTDLNLKAQRLALFLGSRLTAVKIVTPSGITLADHGFGEPGQWQPLRLSAATIHQLINLAAPARTTSATPAPQRCTASGLTGAQPISRHPPPHNESVVTQDGLILLGVPLGGYQHPVGYALLGRSFSGPSDTIRRTEIAFATGALVALVLAGLIALPLINRALRPLRRVADTASAIAAGDLHRRAGMSDSPDEIGRLGESFDTMVDRLQAALTAANESEARMRRFLADASHELRTPLTVLRGMSEVLLRQRSRQGVEDDGTATALRDMHEEAVRLSRLVDDLLTLTRLDAGQSLNPEVVQIRPFLEQFVDRYGGAWPSRRLELEVEPLDGASAYVDPEALRRVVTNLVENAARYSTPGEPITLQGEAGEEGVTVAVHDEGPGLSPEDADRVFERFYRGAKSRSRDSGGTGLGLAIVRGLVQSSGGQVEMDSAPDRGTTVTITLPRVDGQAAPEKG